MSSEQELQTLLSSLQNTLKVQSALMTKFEQREARMQASFDQRMQALQSEVAQAHGRVDSIVGGASSRIAKEAMEALAPVAARHERDVLSASTQLRRANGTVWMLLCTAGSILLLVLLVGWAVLGYYRRELAVAKDELGRYEDAIPVLQAYSASDAAICGDRICVNVDPDARRQGHKGQYRQARSRPPP